MLKYENLCFERLTVRDRGDQMMGDVVVGDVVEEESSSPAQKRPVDGGDGPTNEGPGIFAEMGHGGIGVVEVSQHNDPVVGQQVRDGIVFDDGGEVGHLNPLVDHSSHGDETNIGGDDLPVVLLLEETGAGRVMLKNR